jgi:RES domain-containing protein
MASESKRVAKSLDRALDDTFPASDPPAMTSPSTATPSMHEIASTTGEGELRIYRVIDAGDASQPFAPSTSGGRWTPPGMPCVYASLSPATALLEYLVHLEGATPHDLLLAVASVRRDQVLHEANEPSTWNERPYRGEVQQVGAAWLASGRSLALCVPSAICVDECNVLLNPGHQDHAMLQLVALRPITLDERLRT